MTGRKLRVWHVSSNRWNSAITEYALSAARALAARGHESLFSPLVHSPAERRAGSAGLACAPLASFGLASLARARRLAKEFAPDRIMVYGGPESSLAFGASRAAGAPVPIVRFFGREPPPFRPLAAVRQRLSHAHVALVVTPSATVARALGRLMPRQPIAAVTLGCDAQRFVYRAGARQNHPAEVVILGRFDPVKGHAAAFELFARMRASAQPDLPPCRLWVVGEAANLDASTLERQAEAQGLALGPDVRITAARIADISAVLGGAALGWVPSLGSELICRVAEEFLLCGTPVLVSGKGSLDETIVTEDDGASYGGLDVDGAARLLAGWIERGQSENEAARSARAARARAAFSLEAMGAKLERLLLAL